ncbi:MAG TPA: putative transporter [Bacteroidales bacterium]|nr:putative transporter [Bacteroidales bacterium]HPS17902.1 putative transporter [Bacteroidales bacterium]
MNWFNDLFWKESIAQAILIYSLVITSGVLLGKIKIHGISLGVTFVLFTGIIVGHLGFRINYDVLDFIKNFGLVLFVFFIGLQVGPGFFSSFRKGGIALNLLAISVVLLGTVITIILHFTSGISMPMLTGIMSGAVTNTPGLGAAQQALSQISGNGEIQDIGLGYAVAYPFGVIGIIISMIIIRRITKTDINLELKNFEKAQHPEETIPDKTSIIIDNPDVFGKKIKDFDNYLINDAVISRIQQNNEIKIANAETILNKGDVILLIAHKGSIPELTKLFGSKSDKDISLLRSKLISKQVLVTNRHIIGKELASLKLRPRFGINITRVYRTGIEFIASPDFKIQIGDKLTIVGDETSIENVAQILGNSIKQLNEPNLFPIFTGIIFGVILGSIPIAIHGIPTPVKLGMAGGPLIVAILLSRYGYKFSLNAYTTPSANIMLREIGIVLFLASVGIKAGENFVTTLVSGDGFTWMGYGALITFIPVIIIGLITRVFMKRNFLETCGLISGSMTDPPALAFANSIAQSEAPAIAYATVYPLTMFLRVIIAQMLILFFA